MAPIMRMASAWLGWHPAVPLRSTTRNVWPLRAPLFGVNRTAWWAPRWLDDMAEVRFVSKLAVERMPLVRAALMPVIVPTAPGASKMSEEKLKPLIVS